MAKQSINIGSSQNKGDGDPLRTAFTKINNNFDELYTADTTYISLATLKTEVAAATDFADFKARIAAL
jgi:hypothetical protein|tara:strand:- start:395 stop:598 length:204 start_codon:yes stop_codon:yes gene_type:complete